eukprot:Clim_evm50s157 gene=Clim_evmTU50s157
MVDTEVPTVAESAQEFHDAHIKKMTNLESILLNLDLADKKVSLGKVEEVLAALETQQKEITEAAHFLPSYDLARHQEKLNGLKHKALETRSKVQPRKKFAFSSKRTNAAPAKAPTPPPASDASKKEEDEKEGRPKLDLVDIAPEPDVADRKGEHIIIDSEKFPGGDLALANLTNCLIDIRRRCGALHLSNITDCVLLCGPIKGSCLMYKCEGSKLYIMCQQLRIHDTYDTDFYLYVHSSAIIEDCDRVRFGPFVLHADTRSLYADEKADFAAYSFSAARNRWHKVEDFKWLRPGEPSPHWQTIPEDQRLDRDDAATAKTEMLSSPTTGALGEDDPDEI